MSINLLPPEQKQSISYARRNTVLRKWVIAATIGVLGIVVVVAVGSFFISQSTKNQQAQVTDMKNQLAVQKQTEVEQQVSSISNSIKLTLQVLQRQIFFSKLLVKVGEVMPSGTLLEGLTISSQQNSIDLAAAAKDYQTATQVQINITDPSKKLFDDADILNVTCSDTGAYPCKVSLRATFAKDSGLQFTTGTKK